MSRRPSTSARWPGPPADRRGGQTGVSATRWRLPKLELRSEPVDLADRLAELLMFGLLAESGQHPADRVRAIIGDTRQASHLPARTQELSRCVLVIGSGLEYGAHPPFGADARRGAGRLGLSVSGRLERSEAPVPDRPGRGVHAALARQWVGLSPLQMWVLADSLPACRGPTIACMGIFDDLPALSLAPG